MPNEAAPHLGGPFVSNRTLKRTGRAGIALAVGCAFAAVPVAAQAAPVNLGTVSPFVVLGGSTVTNTGPSVLNGDLGVAPGTALTGFGLPAVVNGATHDNDGVANQAKADLGTAYDVAAGQPVSGANDLTGTNLGNRVLTAGAYRYTSSAQLTGPLTLDAAGDPNAQFVFEISSALTTASASSVVLVNGASPCNVFWQVGTSATLGSTTAFKGNLMALASISLNNAVTVQGRMLARNGQISLINDVIDGSMCGTSSSAPTPTPTSGGGTGSGTTPGSTGSQAPPASRSGTPTHNGTATLRRPPTVTASRRPPGAAACTAGFQATVRGHLIRRVVFSLDGKRIGTRTSPAFRVYVHAAGGSHVVSARVGFKDATHSKTVRFRYRACAAQVLRPRRGPSQFTG
jgi:hypothetical protein